MSISLLQPHIVSNVIDDSELVAEVQSDDTLTLFAVITSTKGTANKVLEFYDSNKIIAEYGKPDYRIHGLAYVNVINAVKGGAKALIMRAVPVDNADTPNIASGSLSNVFLDIQTKEVDMIPASLVPLTTTTLTVADDSSNDGQTTITIPDAGFASSTELEMIDAGNEVVFFEDVTGHTSDPLKVVTVALEYYAQSSSFSTVGIVNGADVTLKFSSGDVAATIAESNGSDGITRFSMLLECASDISSDEDVLMIATTSGNIIGYASKITQVGLVRTKISAVTIVSDVDASAITGDVADIFSVSVNGGSAIVVNLSGLDLAAAATAFSTVDDLTVTVATGTFLSFLNTVSNTSSIEITAPTAAMSKYFTVGHALRTDDVLFIEDINIMNIDNVAYGSNVFVDAAVSVDTSGVVTGKSFEVFSGKGKSTTSLYIKSNGTTPLVTQVSGQVMVKVTSSITGRTVANSTNSTKEINIISFSRNSLDTTADAGKLFLNFKQYGPLVEVRPVALSKKANTVDELASFMLNPYSDPFVGTTDGGFKRHILFGVSKGMSLEENSYGLRFSANNQFDEDSDGFRNFNVEVTNTVNSVVKVIGNPYVISFDQDATDDRGENMSISAILSTYDTTFSKYGNNDEYLTLLDDLSAAAEGLGVDIDPGSYDFLLETPRDVLDEIEDEQSFIKIVNTPFSNDDTSINIGGSSAFPLYKESLLTKVSTSVVDSEVVRELECSTTLAQGSSGSLDGIDVNGNVLTATEKRTLVENLTVDGYNGTLNDEIFNKTAYPIDVIFDGKYSADVKTAIVDFITHPSRKDIFFYGDMGDSPNYLTTLTNRKTKLAAIDTYQAALFGQEYVVYDNYTKTDMKTSLVHAIAKRLASNDIDNGPQEPLAGPNFRLSGYNEGSLSFNPNQDQKEVFIKNKINYAEKDTADTSTMMTQTTSQRKTSELSYINNVRVLLKMIYLAESIARKYQHATWAKITTTFKSDLETAMEAYTGNEAVEYIQITVSSTEYEKRRKKAHIYAKVKFTERMESFVFDWTVTV